MSMQVSRTASSSLISLRRRTRRQCGSSPDRHRIGETGSAARCLTSVCKYLIDGSGLPQVPFSSVSRRLQLLGEGRLFALSRCFFGHLSLGNLFAGDYDFPALTSVWRDGPNSLPIFCTEPAALQGGRLRRSGLHQPVRCSALLPKFESRLLQKKTAARPLRAAGSQFSLTPETGQSSRMWLGPCRHRPRNIRNRA